MARFYGNENFPCPVVEGLRRMGNDVQTVQDTGRAGEAWADEKVLAHAASEGRVLLTINRRHFIALHSEFPDHSGIVVCSLDLDFDGLAQRIHDAVLTAGDMRGRLIRLNRPGQ